MTIIATPANSGVAEPVTFRVTVAADNSTTPAGVVRFSEGATDYGIFGLDGYGRAECLISSLPVGDHTISAAFTSATGDYQDSSNSCVQHVEARAARVEMYLDSATGHVVMSCPTPNVRIFYRASPIQFFTPTHTGNNAGPGTSIYSANSTVIVSPGETWHVRALAWVSGLSDSYTSDLLAENFDAPTFSSNNPPIDAHRREGFGYDGMGNRRGISTLPNRGSVTFTNRSNGLNEYAAWVSGVSYDANGVVTNEGSFTASFNALHQPISISHGTSYVWFGYDPLGRCVKRWTGASGVPGSNPAAYFYYDGWDMIQDGSSSTKIDRRYVHGAGVDEIVADWSPSRGWSYHHSDAQGNCILLTGGSANIIEQYAYDAFGKPYFYNANGNQLEDLNAVGNRFLFTGREWLADLQLYDYRNRLYHPELGRFIQPDPKEFDAGDYNLYRYCHNDPVNRNDPFGLDTTVVWSNEGNRDLHEPVVVKNGFEYTAVTEPSLNVTVSPAAPNGDVVATVHYKIDVRYSDNVGPHNKEVQKKEPDHAREMDKWRDERGKPATDKLARHDGPLQGKSPEKVKEMVDHRLRGSFNDAASESHKKHDVIGDHLIKHPDGIRY
ncbi:MAG: RHS repeat-associated core domain-containing protein [Chthoniobacterales bacterium]